MTEVKDKNTEEPHQNEGSSEIESSKVINADFIAELLWDRLVELRQDWELGDPPDGLREPDPVEIPDAPDQVFGLLALAGAVMRMDGSLLERKIPALEIKWLMQHLPAPLIENTTAESKVAAWLPAAIKGFPDLAAWRDGAELLDESYEMDWEPIQRTTLARRLLSDLDDTELVCNILREVFPIENKAHQQRIEEVYDLVDWTINNSSIFIPAAAYVKAMLKSFSAKVEETTAEKFKAIEKDVQEALDVCLFTEPAGLKEEEIQAIKDLVKELKQEEKQRGQESRLFQPEPAFQSYLEELAEKPSEEVEMLTRRPNLFSSSSLAPHDRSLTKGGDVGIGSRVKPPKWFAMLDVGRVVARAASKNRKLKEGPLWNFVPAGTTGKTTEEQDETWTASLKIKLPEELKAEKPKAKAKAKDKDKDKASQEEVQVRVWVRDFHKPLARVYLCGIAASPEHRADGLWLAQFSLNRVVALWSAKDVPTLVLETSDGELEGGVIRD